MADKEYYSIGKGEIRQDAALKVTGAALYSTDIHPKGMVYGKILGSPIPHGIIKSIDMSEAEKLPGVVAVVTGEDGPDHPTVGGYLTDKFIMCRAGASTLSELTYMGKPVILVPSPNVTNNHQEKNARVLERAGGAKVFLENEFEPETLLACVRELLHDEAKLDEMSKAMASLAVTDATDRICGIILDIVHEKN